MNHTKEIDKFGTFDFKGKRRKIITVALHWVILRNQRIRLFKN